MGCDHTPHTDDNGIFVPPFLDQDYCNTDNIPLYNDMPGNYKWGERTTGGRKIGTGGEVKYRFTVQLSCTKVEKSYDLSSYEKLQNFQ